MSFDWRDFLIVAHELRNDPREGVQRTSIGRAYYYVYNLGLAKARTLDFRHHGAGMHKQLWRWCESQQDQTIKQMGIKGQRMHSFRIDADYKDATVQPAAVTTQLKRARDFEILVAKSNEQAPPQALPL